MNFKKLTLLAHNFLFDMKYGSFLGGIKKTPYATIGANDTANSDYYTMSIIFKKIIKTGDVLVDVGCGKGRVINYWLDNFLENQIVGIELDHQVAQKTARRLANYKNVTIISGNVIELIPDNANLFYLFNPFNCEVMKDFKESLINKFFNKNLGWAHSFQIVYYNPVCAHLFLDDFKFICSYIELPLGYHKCLLIGQSTI